MKSAVVVATLFLFVLSVSVLAQQESFQKVPIKVVPEKEETKPSSPEQPSGEKELRFITTFDFPPFSFRRGMERIGFEIDLGNAIAKELGAKATWIQKSFNINAFASALDSGSADAVISAITINEERKKRLAFTRPYFRTSLCISVHRDVDWRHNYFTTGMKRWLIGVQRGTTAERWARRNLTGKVKTYYSPKRLFYALKQAKPKKPSKELLYEGPVGAFCVLADKSVTDYALCEYGYRVKIVEEGFDKQNYGIAVSKEKPKLLSEINGALKRLDEKDIYDKIYKKWFTRLCDLPK